MTGALDEHDARIAARRAFLKRAGLAVLGATAAAPVVGSASARAAEGTPAYVNAPNTFSADQTVQARLGVGVSPGYPLHVSNPNSWPAVYVTASTMALLVQHEADWAGQTFDLVNLFHKSSGDAVFVAHQGGLPPGYTGSSGACSGLNVLIPYNIDDTTTGRAGSVVNNRNGMAGLFVQSQATQNTRAAAQVQNWSAGPALEIDNQMSGGSWPTVPQGVGSAIQVYDQSSGNGVVIEKLTQPASLFQAALQVQGAWAGSASANPGLLLAIVDGNGVKRGSWDSTGQLVIYNPSNGNQVIKLQSDGTAGFGASPPFGSSIRLNSVMTGAGMQRALGLVNKNGENGDGTQIEFDSGSAQFAVLGVTYDNVTAGERSATMRFAVQASNQMTERLRLNGTGIGFFGSTPVPKPTITGSRNGNPALANLLGALAHLGLVTDATTA